MPNTKPWLMTPEELERERRQFAKDYFGVDGHIFNSPHGAGYWLYGVTYHSKRGWLAFEFYDSEVDPHEDGVHKAAVKAWKNGEQLPERYFALTTDVVEQVFKNAIRRYGEEWLESNIDLPSTENALQWTILREIRYG